MKPSDTVTAPVADAPDPPDSIVASPGVPESPDTVAAVPADQDPPDSVVASPGDPDGTAEAAPTTEPAKITLLEGMKVLFDEKVGLAPVQVIEKTKPIKGGDARANGYLH